MIEWLKQTINPVGTEKKNRGALFSLIARVFEIVRKDAEKAFNAHFPFLADEKKLAEHARALSIPHMESDTQEEFRNRVAAASFFLSRAGERSYILGQLEEHLGERYACKEEFLKVFVKVVDLSDEDRKWVITFLDTILDPNIFLSIAEWFHCVEKVFLQDTVTIKMNLKHKDSFRVSGIKINGSVKLDARTVNDLSIGHVRIPIKLGRGILDTTRIRLNVHHTDRMRINDKIRMGIKYNHTLTGGYKLDGKTTLNSGIIIQV